MKNYRNPAVTGYTLEFLLMNDSYIATYNENVKENETFLISVSILRDQLILRSRNLSVNDDQTIYIQQDFGDVSLLNELEAHGLTDYVYRFISTKPEEACQPANKRR